MTETPHGEARPLHRGTSESSRGRLWTALYYGRRYAHVGVWGAAKRRPKLPCQSALAQRRPREGSEGPLWRVSGLPLGQLCHGQVAQVTTYPDLLRLRRLPCTNRVRREVLQSVETGRATANSELPNGTPQPPGRF
eukprot:10080394-Alexandrium_andersonii.AAC.1